MKILNNIQLFYMFHLFFLTSVNSFAQSISPQDLHFIKDYQIRNFYNSQLILSQLDFSKKILSDPSYKLNHFTSPGCDFHQEGGLYGDFWRRSRHPFNSSLVLLLEPILGGGRSSPTQLHRLALQMHSN